MDNILDYIEKYKFAIIGTVLFHVLIFLSANFVTMKRPIQLQEPVVEVAIPLEDIEFDEEMEKLLQINKNEGVPEQVYNVVSDANDSREKSYENFSTQDIDEEVMNNARELEQQYFEEWAATHPGQDPSDYNTDIRTNEDDNKDKNNQNNVNKNNIDTEGSNAFAGSVIASFDLKNRNAHSLDKPGYTCNHAGTVVVEIKVDQNGKVKAASYLSERSSGATECMIEQAVKYAKRARFNYSSSAPSVQTGTITYKFVKR